MKKAYVKPQLYFDSFELNTSIATGCSAGYNHENTTFSNANSCVLKFGTDTVFLNVAICSLTEFDENQFCYHVPTSNDKVFSS